jgi:hypothetical protein
VEDLEEGAVKDFGITLADYFCDGKDIITE